MQINTNPNDHSVTLDMSAKLLYEEAQNRGITCTTFGDSQTILMQKNEKQWYTIGARTSLQSSVGRTIANQKNLTKKILEYFKIPTAKFVEVKNVSALSQIAELSFPLVMKPVSGAHGDNVIVGIKSQQEAEKAFLAYKKPVLFEELLIGTEYRVVCIDYKFAAAAYRKPAHVTGDGVSTVATLIDKKNQHPLRGVGHTSPLTKIIVDEQVLEYVAQQDSALDHVPEKDQDIFLRRTANLSTGGEAYNVTDLVSPENRILFEKIARVCDLNTLGIDIMCTSLSKPIIEQSNAGVIEVNGSPGLRMHQYPLTGEPINLAKLILDMVAAHI